MALAYRIDDPILWIACPRCGERQCPAIVGACSAMPPDELADTLATLDNLHALCGRCQRETGRRTWTTTPTEEG